MKNLLLIIFFGVLMSSSYAQTYYYSQPNYNTIKTYSHNNDQQRCEAEANYMARNRISGHVWGTIGRFEGVGFGYSPNCNTCSPGNGMVLTGDASAMDSSGRWYRVRSWR